MSFDPGAKRCGFAVVGDGPELHGYGYFGLERGEKEQYQPYRLRLVQFWVKKCTHLFHSYDPSRVVVEIVPAAGYGEGGASNMQLSITVATTIQAMATLQKREVDQVSAAKVKKAIGGIKDASKVKVRNGVTALIDSYDPGKGKDWDIYDAIALGLYDKGHKV